MYEFKDLNLKSLEALNEDVEKLIPTLVNSLEDTGQSAGLTIKLKFKRLKDSQTFIEVTHCVTPTYPSRKRTITANRDLTGNLRANPEDLGTNVLPRQKSLMNTVKEV